MHDVETCPPCAQAHGREYLVGGDGGGGAVVDAVARCLWSAADLNARRRRLLRDAAALAADVELLSMEARRICDGELGGVAAPVAARSRRLLLGLSDPAIARRVGDEVARLVGVWS